jgi:hypothetical protein
MYQFTDPQKQVHQMLGVHQEHGQNQNFWRAPEPPVKQEFHIQQPAHPTTGRQTGSITPFQGPAEPMIKRDSHAQGQLMVYDGRQSPFARNACPAQNVPYRNPSVENRGSPHGENHRKKAARVSQASIHYML